MAGWEWFGKEEQQTGSATDMEGSTGRRLGGFVWLGSWCKGWVESRWDGVGQQE